MIIDNKPLCGLSKILYLLDKEKYFSTIHLVAEHSGNPITKSEFQSFCKTNLLCYLQFVSYIDEKTLTWKRTKINLDDHILDCNIQVSSKSMLQKEINKFVQSRISIPFDNDKPPWNFYIINNNVSKKQHILLNLSHCMGDGQVLTAIMSSLDDSNVISDENKKINYLKKHKNDYATYLKYIFFLLSIIVYIKLKSAYIFLPSILYLIYSNRHLLKNIYLLICKTKPSSIRSNPETIGSNKLFEKGKSMSIDKLKRIQERCNLKNRPSINDLITTMIGGAIGKYNKNLKYTSNKVCLFTLFGMNRNTQSQKELLDIYKSHKEENLMSYSYVEIDADTSIDISDRLQNNKRELDKAKTSLDLYFILCVAKLVDICQKYRFLSVRVNDLFLKLLKYIMKNICDSYISNVQFPKNNMKILGRKITKIYNCTSPLQFGTTFNILSYNDDLTICCATDKNTISNPKVLLDYITDEYNELCKLYL